jgi:hypothetical protein
MQRQTQELINFNVNYHSDTIAFTVVKQCHAKEGRMMRRERVGHPPKLRKGHQRPESLM